MKLRSVNPATGKVRQEYKTLSKEELGQRVDKSADAFLQWRHTNFKIRQKLLQNVAQNLRKNKVQYGRIITLEMGKLLSDAVAEVEKCAWVCEYYAEHSESMLRDEVIKTDAKKSLVMFQPLGITLAIMPWNFPFWQVFRQAAPALMAGNTVLLKHASNVPESALQIETIFKQSGALDGIFQTLLISASSVESIIADPRVRLVNLTGSEVAGSTVASQAGRYIKRSVLELGGSDPFIVLDDADVKKAAEAAATARLIVSGQSCIAAKRFIIHRDIYPQFLAYFKANLEQRQMGDPLDPDTTVCPLFSTQGVQDIHNQVTRSIQQGATLVCGGYLPTMAGFYYPPTILTDVTDDMVVMQEETFGPVAAVMVVENDHEALRVANNSRFGLGASVWTKDSKRAQVFIDELESGGVYVNSMVRSDPRLPFGGTKFSGYGRELADYGIKEFVNIKTVWID